MIPTAGLGTRFLPATKTEPKEMLPVIDKPVIQWIMEEAIASVIKDILIIMGKGKRAIEDHSAKSELENEFLDEIDEMMSSVNLLYKRQREPRGLGNAVYYAKSFVGEEAFALLLGDTITIPECTREIIKKGIEKIFVTGSSGTIGTALCEALMEKGYEVVGIDIKQNKWSEKVDGITIISDLRDRNFFRKLSDDFDMVIHLAANARVYNLVKNPILARDNFEMLFNILEFSRLKNIDRFIFASSREVYGNSDKIFHKEDEAYVKNCESPYTATKIGGEALAHSYHQCYGIDFLIPRFSNVYGRYDDSDRVIPVFIARARQNEDLIVFGKEKLLDFTFIDDCVDGIMKSIEMFDVVKNNTFNIASGNGIR